MADIDLTLELAGTDAAAESTRSLETEIRSMRREFSHGVEAVKGLEDGFKALSGQGRFTIGTLMELSKLPMALASPVGAATVAIGLLAEGLHAVWEEGEKVKQQALDAQFAKIVNENDAATASQLAYND